MDRQVFDGTLAKFDVGQTRCREELGGILACQDNHLRRHIYTDNPTGVPNFLSRQENILAGPAPQIENDIAIPEMREGYRIPAGQT